MLDADTIQALAPWITREDAGRLLAPLCRAAATVVRAADAAEDAGHPEIWRRGPPMWDIARVNARIDARWAEDADYHSFGLDRVLKSLAVEIQAALEDDDIELVFERRQARARRQASVLGCHSLRVLDAKHFLWTMQTWVIRTGRQDWAHHSVWRYGGRSRLNSHRQAHAGRTPGNANTQLVLNLLHVLGLRARRGPGMRFDADEDVREDEVLWNREYVAGSVSARASAPEGPLC